MLFHLRSVLAAVLIGLNLLVTLACPEGADKAGAWLSQPRSNYSWTRITEKADFPTGYNYPVYVAQGKMWAFHAEGVWSSSDGAKWQLSQLPSVRRNVYQSYYVQFTGAIYALGDNSGNYENLRFVPRIRRTVDFKSWEEIGATSNLPSRMFAGVAVFNEKIWLLGGYDGSRYHNDVWNSADGIKWELVTNNAPWSARTVPTLAVFRDKMIVIGGGVIDGTTNSNPVSDKEIWTTTDGKIWNKAENAMPQRTGGYPVEFDDKLWLVGANRDGTFARSSLVSVDGLTWAEESAPWSPRGGATGWVFDNKLFVTGGKYSVTENGEIRFIYSNDVWAMEKKKT